MIDRCVSDWLARQNELRQLRELQKLADDLSEAQRKAAPLRNQAAEIRRAGRRQDGPRGFVMVD